MDAIKIYALMALVAVLTTAAHLGPARRQPAKER